MEQRISLVTLGVTDLQRSAAFYESLGWTPAQRAEDIVFFQLNGLALALHPRKMLADDANLPDAESTGFSGITLAYNVRSKEEVHEVIDQARQAGGRVSQEPHDTTWGGYNGYFLDPDGHAWEVAWNPFSPLDAQGNFILGGGE